MLARVRALTGRSALAGAAIALLAATLLFTRLDDTFLWQDEAQTALIARTLRTSWLPLGGDGRNSFSQELGKELGPGGVWRWHSWLSFYAVAASFRLFGETTFAARLPFVLCGLACVGLAGLAGLRLWRDPLAGALAAGWLATCVPFLILARQSRYYALAALFALWGLMAWTRLAQGRRGAPALWLALTGAFHAHHVVAGALLASVWLHAALCERAALRRLLAPSLAFLALNLPFGLWLAGVRPGGEGYLASVLDPGKALAYTLEYVSLARYFFPAWLLAIPAGLALDRARRGEPVLVLAPETRSHAALLLLFCGASFLTHAVLSPLLYFRYLAPVAAPLAVLAALPLSRLLRRSRALGAGALALWLATGSLPAFMGELTHDFAGPLEGIVGFLRGHAREGDDVAIPYGDMPLKFYTDLRVIGALTGEDPALARTADWVIVRRHTNTEADARMKRALERLLAAGGYRRRVIDAPDTQFENREDPRLHRFRSAPARTPRVVIWERIR
jgi:hypothetical protein